MWGHLLTFSCVQDQWNSWDVFKRNKLIHIKSGAYLIFINVLIIWRTLKPVKNETVLTGTCLTKLKYTHSHTLPTLADFKNKQFSAFSWKARNSFSTCS